MSERPVTGEGVWAEDLARRRLPSMPLAVGGSVVVVAAHPDDETLGVAGFLQSAHEAGAKVTLIVVTDGEAAFELSELADHRSLARTRRAELRAALAQLGLDHIEVRWLGLPDSAVAEHEAELTDLLRDLLAGATLCLAPWPADPHPDHQAAGRAMLAAAPLSAHRWSYPVWLWHWMRPDNGDITWSQARGHQLSGRQLRRKRAAMAEFASQVNPGPRGQAPILPPAVLTHFTRETEVLFHHPRERSAPLSRFAQLYGANPDPWHTEGSWYERRKRELVLAALPNERYEHAVEPACGPGALTHALSGRCHRLLAFDAEPAAVSHAQAATADDPGVTVRRGTLPADLPPGPSDLVVLSEILYYLDDADLDATIDGAVRCLRAGGDLLAAHWRPWAPEAPRAGADAHNRLLARPELRPIVEHTDEQFLLHVLRRR